MTLVANRPFEGQTGSWARLRTSSGHAYFETGTGEPLVLVHGVGLRLEAWAPQIAALSRDHRIIAVDMPGHGESAPLTPGSSLDAYVGWLINFFDALGLERVNLAGHSMGALISCGAAVTAPQRILRLAILNGVHRRDPAASAAVVARAEAIPFTGVDVEGPLERWFPDEDGFAKLRDRVRDLLQRMDTEAYATAYNAFARGDALYADDFAKITAPALFLTGALDGNSTPAMAQAMAAMTQRGCVRVVSNHRHMVSLTAADEVNRLLTEWLQLPVNPS